MSKMSELSAMIDNLISCGETLAETGRALKEFYSETEEAAPAKPEKKTKKQDPTPAEAPAEKQYSKEEVRGILAKKANEADGRFKADVKAIVHDRSEVRQRRQPYQCGSEGLRGACQRGGRIN